MAKSNTRITADKDEVAIYTYEYTATSGQTTFSGSDDNSATLDYTAGSITVSYGGLELPESDYTATNGTSVVLADGAVAGEIIRVVAYEPFVVSDALPITGGTLTGGLNVSSGNVGIGTSSPSAALEVSEGGGANTVARFTNSAQANSYIQFNDTATAVRPRIGSVGNNLVLDTSNTERMRIDSSGIVTKPNHPAFDVSMSAGGPQTGIMVHDVTYVDNGNNHNTSNGHFTAPVTGVYYFYTTYINNVASAPTGRRYFQKNGVRIYGNRHLRLDGNGGYGDNGILAITVSLSAGDYLRIEQGAGSSYGTTEYEVFGGYLIG